MFHLQIRGLETEKVWDIVQTLNSHEGRQNIHPLTQKVTKRGFVLNGHNLLLTTNQLILIVPSLCERQNARWQKRHKDKNYVDFSSLESIWQGKVTYRENKILRPDLTCVVQYLLNQSILPFPPSLPLSSLQREFTSSKCIITKGYPHYFISTLFSVPCQSCSFVLQ